MSSNFEDLKLGCRVRCVFNSAKGEEEGTVICHQKQLKDWIAVSDRMGDKLGDIKLIVHGAVDPNFQEVVPNVSNYNGRATKYLRPDTKFTIISGKKKQAIRFPNGLNCQVCKEHYPFAEPNQPDENSLVCWACREYPMRKYY